MKWSIAILWLISAIRLVDLVLLPNFIRCGHRQGPLTACKYNLKNIGTALEMYSTDYNGQYPRNLDLLKPNYLKSIPQCPKAGYQTYRASFGRKAPGNKDGRYRNYHYYACTGHHHADAGIPPDFPRYDAVGGLCEELHPSEFPVHGSPQNHLCDGADHDSPYLKLSPNCDVCGFVDYYQFTCTGSSHAALPDEDPQGYPRYDTNGHLVERPEPK